ncbi:MAG: hypothetical protein LBU42_06830 [Prevotellaceae bacterium]|jgi:hypothetical protein|nr:hypothetical protein [Prevotellaceae bacterium]
MEKIQQLGTIVSETLTKRGLRCKLWNKGEIFRLYLYSDALYDTKKCKQTAYIDLKRYCVHVSTECPSQPDVWCISQSREAEGWFEKWARYTRFVAYKLGVIAEQKVEAQAKQEAQERINETYPIVKGYYLEWRSVRIPINSFGKLATRNRQHIRTWEGFLNLVPRGFVTLTDNEYVVAKSKEGDMVEPYTTPNFS